MKNIIFATHNEDKMKEIREIMKDLQYRILSLKDIGLKQDVIENGESFEDNAILKAKAFMDITGEIVLADDSGLEVDFLDKAPGIYSARFLGEDTSYSIKNQYIIDKLKHTKGDDRSARFVCAVACAFPSNEIIVKRGVIEGVIANEIMGSNGFGYDPIFYVPSFKCTTAQMDIEIKNKISHRALALTEIKKVLLKR
ncbi:MAG TPA: RdgB/HAM1 family non-canonical purine NTP pyrophosphatase [Clostridiales bacterium]|nr:RdgB/HAM1 family non-canonical purine NTP pyrophosphatase [Clostridiales bacterium]